MMGISITKPISHLFDRSLSKPLSGCTSVASGSIASGSVASGSIGASTLDSASVGGDSVGFRDVLIRNPF